MTKKLFSRALGFQRLTSLALAAGMSFSVSAETQVDSANVNAQQNATTSSSTAQQQPSIKSNKVAVSLLQDVVRVGDRLVAVGERGHIIWSDDNGKTWQQADVPTRQMLNAVYFPTQEKGWAVGYDGLILNTIDGGKTWSLQLDGLKFVRERSASQLPTLEADKESRKVEMIMAKAALVQAEEQGKEDLSAEEDAISALEDQLDMLDDSISDAHEALKNTVAHPLMDVWFKDEQQGYAVGAFGEFIRTVDGGATWESINGVIDNPDRNHLNAIAGRGDAIFVTGEAGHIFKSSDAGTSWTLLESPDPENGSFFAVSLLDDKQVVIVGLRGAIYRSNDQGDTWKQVDEPLHKNMNAVRFAGNDVLLLVGNDGAFLRSRDAGRTFEAHIQADRLTLASVVEASNGDYILVGAGGIKVLSATKL